MPTDPQPQTSRDGPPTRRDSDPLRALAAVLRSIATRASEQWPGWTDEDQRALAAAADGLEATGAALADGMRQAFEMGREYRHREELLEQLNAEIGEISGSIARQAWGGGGAPEGGARGGGGDDG